MAYLRRYVVMFIKVYYYYSDDVSTADSVGVSGYGVVSVTTGSCGATSGSRITSGVIGVTEVGSITASEVAVVSSIWTVGVDVATISGVVVEISEGGT